MRIVVCAKVINGELNPFDESALEYALRLSRDVTLLTMGPPSARDVLLPLTRLGAKAVLLSDTLFAGSDTLATAYVLSEAIKKIGYDLVVCGRQSIDGDTAQVGPMLSEMLGIGVITSVIDAECNESTVTARTREGYESLPLPALITMERSFVLRFPSIFSRVGEVSVWSNAELGCDERKCGLVGSPTRVVKTFESERGRRRCRFISFDELLPLIDELRHSEHLKTKELPASTGKLKKVFAVGEEVYQSALEIGECVVKQIDLTPTELAELVKKEKPDAILWNADRRGRRDAPIVAAMLGAGLCADCTMLECDGEELYMYRPALSGSITAKIKSLTRPVMATVRCDSFSSGVVVSVGKGASGKMDKARELANLLGAELTGSRGAVDMGLIPYEGQIGVTGRVISPNIYLAIGISGAVHHTTAIEGAGKIIAINPDKDARIFDYADYGITEPF